MSRELSHPTTIPTMLRRPTFRRIRVISRAARGVAAVEFAIMATVLVPLLLAASEFGRAMYQYDTVVKGVRAGARYLSQLPPNTNIAAAKNIVVYGTTAPGQNATPLVPGLTTAMVYVRDASSDASTHWRVSSGAGTPLLNLVTVRVEGLQFQTLSPSVLPAFTFDTVSATMTQGPSL